MKKIEKTNKIGMLKVIIIFMIIVAMLILVGIAFARYITKLNGQAEAQVANWTFKVNGSTNDTFEIDLANTRAGIPQEANVEEGYIAPGTAGSFTITIDASNSEASLTYDLIINSSNIPKNLVFYSDSNFENVLFYADSKIEFGDYINYNDNNKTRSKTFYWKWPYESGILQEEIAENDEDDSQWMGDEISLSVNVVGKQIDAEPNYLVKTAELGDYVNYVDKNGNTILCRVLYNDNINGFQIISADEVQNVTLGRGDPKIQGNTDLQKAQNSYNRAIITLNDYATEYLNSDISYNARCVGSKPNNKNFEGGLYTNNYGYFLEYNSKFKKEDNNYNYDITRLEQISAKDIGKSYWLASRTTGASGNHTGFRIRQIKDDASLYYLSIFGIYGEASNPAYNYTNSLRPIFYISNNVKILGGSGTESSPFELEY